MIENRAPREATISRKSNETEVTVSINLDAPYAAEQTIDSGVPFLDHMLNQIARHGNIFLSIEAKGDLEIDAHHTTEDVGIVLGQAFAKALGTKAGIRRYGHARIPLDEALADVVIDLSGRAYLFFEGRFPSEKVGDFDTELVEEFFRAFAMNGNITLHAELVRGRNSHHLIECLFKALARGLREAIATDPDSSDIPSSKGTLS